MNSVTASISLSLSISPPITKPWTQFLPGKCKPLTSSPFNSNFDCKCRALGEGSQSQSQTTQPTVYQGVYGPWTIEDSDIREVILYRSGLVTAAASFVLASSTALLPNDSVMRNLIEKNLDLLYAFGSCGLGLSLYLIHIYVTEIKRALQALWLLGALGSLATYSTLAQSADKNLVQYVIENPIAVWFVGPLFAALTGLVFKEGLCYGKLEAGILTFVIPSLLLGHLVTFAAMLLTLKFHSIQSYLVKNWKYTFPTLAIEASILHRPEQPEDLEMLQSKLLFPSFASTQIVGLGFQKLTKSLKL